MDQHRDEHIVCATCGTSFVFTAAEAAVYAERNLAAPPKRCRDCRRARKEQRGDTAARGPARRGGHYAFPRADARPPRYTGDVNEYRSPMQDTYAPASPTWAVAGKPRPRNGNVYIDDGNYRAPSFSGQDLGRPRGNVLPGHGGPRRRAEPAAGASPQPRAILAGAPGDSTAEATPRGPRAPRRRPMFSITCKSCGAEGQVPFKPIEGRDVFCQPCYRARKPA